MPTSAILNAPATGDAMVEKLEGTTRWVNVNTHPFPLLSSRSQKSLSILPPLLLHRIFPYPLNPKASFVGG